MVFIVVAAILDRMYISTDVQIPLIIGLIVGVFALLIAGVFLQPYFARADNYFEVHCPQRDEPIDLPFHGGREIENPLNGSNPDGSFTQDDMDKIATGNLVPRYELTLFLTEPKDFSDMFPEMRDLGITEVSIVFFQYYLHARDRFDLLSGAIVARNGVPFYHPHAEEVDAHPTITKYIEVVPGQGPKPFPVFEVDKTRKGDFEVFSDPNATEAMFRAYLKDKMNPEDEGEEEAPIVQVPPPRQPERSDQSRDAGKSRLARKRPEK